MVFTSPTVSRLFVGLAILLVAVSARQAVITAAPRDGLQERPPLLKGFTIWLNPPGIPINTKVADLDEPHSLTDLVKTLATESQTFPFLPHLTVQGQVNLPLAEVKKKLGAIVKNFKPFKVVIEDIVFGPKPPDYYKSVMLKIRKTPELMSFVEAVKKAFSTTPVNMADYQPHISIAYGVAGDPQREAVRRRAERWLTRYVRRTPRTPGSDNSDWNKLSWTVKNVQISNTASVEQDWTLVTELPLTRGDNIKASSYTPYSPRYKSYQ